MTTTNQKIRHENGVATLWRYNADLNVYALVWPSEEPNLFSILRKATFTREDSGMVMGPYLYTSTQSAI